MNIRVISYHALAGKDVEDWMQGIASELRGVAGMRRVEFVRSQSDPSQWRGRFISVFINNSKNVMMG